MPVWVKNLLDQCLQSANITSGRLFRRVHKIGKAWGEGLTEKAVWHVLREYAAKTGIDKLAPHDCAGHVLGFATPQEVKWSRSSFCLATFAFRQLSDILGASSGFVALSTTGLALSRLTEGATVCVRVARSMCGPEYCVPANRAEFRS
jgi:hypothetical protein